MFNVIMSFFILCYRKYIYFYWSHIHLVVNKRMKTKKNCKVIHIFILLVKLKELVPSIFADIKK